MKRLTVPTVSYSSLINSSVHHQSRSQGQQYVFVGVVHVALPTVSMIVCRRYQRGKKVGSPTFVSLPCVVIVACALLAVKLIHMRYEEVWPCHAAGEVIPKMLNGLRRLSCIGTSAIDPYIEKRTYIALPGLSGDFVQPWSGTA